MRITEGIRLILVPTKSFDELVAFFRDIMGLTVVAEGVPVTDIQFRRFASFSMPNQVVLEIVEPRESLAHFEHGSIVSITVDDVAGARRELENRRMAFVTPIFDTGHEWGWAYFRAPGGTVFQLEGPYRESRGAERENTDGSIDPPAPHGRGQLRS